MANYSCNNKDCDDIIKILPQRIWEEAMDEVLETGNQGIWSMCLVAIRALTDYWEEGHA